MTVAIQLTKNGLSISTKALADTGANGFAFLDIFLAERLARHFNHHVVPLRKQCRVKGFDGKTENAITHLMILSLVVDGRVMYNLPFLIIRLGKHDVILGRMWSAKYGVMADCARRRLLWPEEVSLKEEIQAKQFVPLPKKPLLRDREVEISHQRDADRRDQAFDRQDDTKPDSTIPRSYGRTYRRSYECELNRMKKELQRPVADPPVLALTPVAVRGPKQVRFKERHPDVDIAVIGAAGFLRNVKDKKTETFLTSISEIEKAIEDKRSTAEEQEEQEIKQQLPERYDQYADVFSKIKVRRATGAQGL